MTRMNSFETACVILNKYILSKKLTFFSKNFNCYYQKESFTLNFVNLKYQVVSYSSYVRKKKRKKEKKRKKRIKGSSYAFQISQYSCRKKKKLMKKEKERKKEKDV